MNSDAVLRLLREWGEVRFMEMRDMAEQIAEWVRRDVKHGWIESDSISDNMASLAWMVEGILEDDE